jgi:NitT/TauT family transport system permease protein
MRTTLRGLAGLLGFLVVWEVVSRAGLVPQQYLPPPSVVFGRLGRLTGDPDFVADVLATVLAALIALGIATLIAVPLGLLLGTVPAVRRATAAIVEFLRPIPSVALIPLALVILGSGPETKITLAAYASVWPILFNTIYAMGEVHPLQIETARAFGLSRLGTLTRVALPNAAPFVLTGIRLASAISLILVVSTELLAGGSGGLGHFIDVARSGGGRMDLVLAGTVAAGLIGYLIDTGFQRAQGRWLAWGPQGADR